MSCGGAGGGGYLLLHRDPDVDLCLADAADPLHHPRMSQQTAEWSHRWSSCVGNALFICILCFQSDVMHLTDDSTKLKLFMDVLDGTKAAVSPPSHDTVV